MKELSSAPSHMHIYIWHIRYKASVHVENLNLRASHCQLDHIMITLGKVGHPAKAMLER